MRKSELFEAFDLFDVRDFGKVMPFIFCCWLKDIVSNSVKWGTLYKWLVFYKMWLNFTPWWLRKTVQYTVVTTKYIAATFLVR